MTPDLQNLKDNIPPWLKRFIKQTGRGINHFGMIKEGDAILLGISGGKDSLALALALSFRKTWIPIDYAIEAVQIEWREYPFSDSHKNDLAAFFNFLDIPFQILQASMFPPSFKGRFDCYLCSRNRKRILFQEAEKRKIEKIALGHHMDDIVETTLINLFFRGNFSTMMPVQEFFKGKLHIIRPLCEVPESMISTVSSRLGLPAGENSCPNKETNLRTQIKPIIRELVKMDRHVRENIYNAPWNINKDYLPS